MARNGPPGLQINKPLMTSIPEQWRKNAR